MIEWHAKFQKEIERMSRELDHEIDSNDYAEIGGLELVRKIGRCMDRGRIIEGIKTFPVSSTEFDKSCLKIDKEIVNGVTRAMKRVSSGNNSFVLVAGVTQMPSKRRLERLRKIRRKSRSIADETGASFGKVFGALYKRINEQGFVGDV